VGRFDAAPQITVDDAIAIRVVGGLDGSAWLAWTDETGFSASAIDADSLTLNGPVLISDDEGVAHHPLERPALTIDEDGTVMASWITAGGEVKFRRLSEGSVTISGSVRPETALVQMIALESGEPVVSWLEDSTLSIATGDPPKEHESVDDLTCDCCHPVSIELRNGFGIGYRDLEELDDGVVRDIRFLQGTTAGVFSESIEVADEHWFLDACPLSGPTLAAVDDRVLIAWMDARQSLHPEQTSSSIWFDRSEDGGRSFGTDIRLTSDDATYRTPAMVVDSSGRLHLVWERRTPDEATIEYTFSDDGGSTFADPVALVEGGSEVPREASLAASGDSVLLSWIDSVGGHLRLIESR
jgi:hypothetical protein